MELPAMMSYAFAITPLINQNKRSRAFPGIIAAFAVFAVAMTKNQ
jgi:hypothetical protein